MRRLRSRAVLVRNQIRQPYRVAEFLSSVGECDRHRDRLCPAAAAHRGALPPLRRTSGARVRRWAASHRAALLHQRRGLDVRRRRGGLSGSSRSAATRHPRAFTPGIASVSLRSRRAHSNRRREGWRRAMLHAARLVFALVAVTWLAATPVSAADKLTIAVGQREIWHGAPAALGERAGIFRKHDLDL